MRPTTLLLHLFVCQLLLYPAGASEELRRIASWAAAPESCVRRELMEHIRHEDVRVRSAALDLLELITGRDFGLDPWLPPSEVPEAVQRALDEWAAVDELVGDVARRPEPEQVLEAVVLLRSADPDTQRRVCLRFEPWRAVLLSALRQELERDAQLSERERDNLRCSLFRLQLQSAMPKEVGEIAPLLTSHARNELLSGLEKLRRGGPVVLPVLMDFADSSDGMIREVAIDVLLQTGGAQAYKILMPQLMAEMDRNILQIAARRAPDCPPIPPIISFLNHCASSQDDDVAVAALDALADMESDSSDGADEESSAYDKPAGAEHALSDECCLRLLKSSNWRVRAAMLRVLQSRAAYIPSLRGDTMRQALIGALRDEDETVRLNALQVLGKRKLVGIFLEELSDFALSTPSATPYIVYLLCSQKLGLSPALIECISRFTPEQVDQLIYFDDSYDTVFNTDDHAHASTREVISSLLLNPDRRVRYRILAAWGRHLFCLNQEWADAFVEWLQDPSVIESDKVEPLRMLAFRTTEHSRRRVSTDALCNWLQQQVSNPVAKSSELRQIIFAALLQLRPAMAEPFLHEQIGNLSPELLGAVLETNTQLVYKIPREVLKRHVSHESVFSALSDALGVADEEDEAAVDELREILWTAEVDDDQFASLVRNQLRALQLRDSFSVDEEEDLSLAEFGDFVQNRLSSLSEERFCMGLFVCASQAPEELRKCGIVLPEQMDAMRREALQCLLDCPQTAEAVLPWAKQYHNSSCAEVRRAIATCLLPFEAWRFYLTRGKGKVPFNVETRLDRLHCKRSSCPAALIRLVQDMQADPDPIVAVTACVSLLYRVGDCDRARLKEVMPVFATLLEKRNTEDGTDSSYYYRDYSALAATVEVMWYRWSTSRTSTWEFFKLKGNPRKLRDGVAPVLHALAEISTEYPWKGSILEDVEAQLPVQHSSRRSSSAHVPQAHEFDYPTAPVEAPDEAATASTGSEASDETSPDEPTSVTQAEPEIDHEEAESRSTDPAAEEIPVRIEFFRKDGCDVCERVHNRLRELASQYPGMIITEYDVESELGRERNSVLSSRFGVPPRERRMAPTLFAEGGYLMGAHAADRGLLEDLVRSSLSVSQSRLQPSPAEPTPAPSESADSPEQPQISPPVEPLPVVDDKLAESTAAENAAAAGEQIWERICSYGVLALGGLVALLALCVLVFSRRSVNNSEE